MGKGGRLRGRWRSLSVIAVATVIVAIATEEAVITRPLWLIAVLIVSAVVAAGAIAAVNIRLSENPREGDAEIRARQMSRDHSLMELAHGGILNRRIDEVLPISRGGELMTVAEFVAELVGAATRSRWILRGEAGSGKSTLLHRVVEAMNARTDVPAAVVVPAATYDWEQESLADWLSGEIAQITGVSAADIAKLIAAERVFVLIDGVEDVPNHLTLTEQKLPGSERAIVDRRSSGREEPESNPRRKLISSLAHLPGFVLSARYAELTDDERAHLESLPSAHLEPIRPEAAWAELIAHAPELRSGHPSEAFVETVRSPLYLRLAARVCGEWGEIPDWTADEEALERWLWDRYLDHRLASRQMQELGWKPALFRHWLASCAAALPPSRAAISIRRWPLLYGPRTREGFRVLRSALSGAITAGIALSFMRPVPAAAVGLVCGGLFLLYGEGAATLPMAVRPFTLARLRRLAFRQGWYALGFAAVGAIAGLVVSIDPGGALRRSVDISTVEAVIAGSAGGAVLTIVPTLYELFYLDDAALFSVRYRDGAIGATLSAATVIGLLGGAIVAATLAVAFPSLAVLVAIPAAVVVAVLDTLGLPFAAIGLWALQGKGPLEVGAFLDIAEEVRVARRFGQYHFLEHSELQRVLVEEERHAGAERSEVPRRLALAGCAMVAVWLVAYSLLHLAPTLPSTYRAAHWRTLWLGFDLIMASLALVTFIAIRRHSLIAGLSAAMLAALLLSDGWFDCLTANSHDLRESLVSLAAEVAGAAFFLWIAVGAVRRSQGAAVAGDP
jgi:NACHT domain